MAMVNSKKVGRIIKDSEKRHGREPSPSEVRQEMEGVAGLLHPSAESGTLKAMKADRHESRQEEA